MKKKIFFTIMTVITTIALIAGSFLLQKTDQFFTGMRFNWYETKNQDEIVKANTFAQERLEKKYYVFVNNILVDIGYEWDGEIYVPIRTVSESLNWQVNWIADLGMIQLIKGTEEAFVDIVNFFGKAYVNLNKLERLLRLASVDIYGGNIKISTAAQEIESFSINKLVKLNFYINEMKMTDQAVIYNGLEYLPARCFAMCFGKPFRYDAVLGHAFIDNKSIDCIFVNGEAFAQLSTLQEVLDTGAAAFRFAEFKPQVAAESPALFKGKEIEKKVALTFDDYLGEKVFDILDVLDKNNVKATFFIIGNSIDENHTVLEELAKKGHEAANHTWDHMNSFTLTEDEFRAQLIATQLRIECYTGAPAVSFRPPGGYYNSKMIRIAQEIGLKTVLWSLNSSDAEAGNSPGVIKDIITKWVHPGAIIVMHTNRDATISALPAIIRELKQRGYEFVTVSEMLAFGGGI